MMVFFIESLKASTSHELGRMIYHYGGDPVGSFIFSSSCKLQPSRPHALFMDVTHDNMSYLEVLSLLFSIFNLSFVVNQSKLLLYNNIY